MRCQKSFEKEGAKLYLVATPIGNLQELTPRAIDILQSVDIIAAEDTRNTMKLLNHFQIKTRVVAHHMHNEKESAKGLLKMLEEGLQIAIVSDAGYPLLSDPGQLVVEQVLAANYPVIPISGSNAAINALVASGIVAQPYLFYGFLGNSEKERLASLYELKDLPYTFIVYEAPHRIEKMLNSCLEVLGNREICLARELTKKHEEFIRGNIIEVLSIVSTLRGEMVVVIEGKKKEKVEVSMNELNALVDTYSGDGMTTKDAIKKIAKEYGISKNDLYKSYHGLN